MIDSHLHAILDTAVDGIILMDAKGKVIMFNRACERIFGYAPAEVVGANVKRLMPKPYQEEHDQYLTNYQRTRERKIIGIGRQVVGQRKSGETFPLDLSVGEVTDGDEVAYVGILRDVSERVRAEEQRERLIEQLRQVDLGTDPLRPCGLARSARADSHDRGFLRALSKKTSAKSSTCAAPNICRSPYRRAST